MIKVSYLVFQRPLSNCSAKLQQTIDSKLPIGIPIRTMRVHSAICGISAPFPDAFLNECLMSGKNLGFVPDCKFFEQNSIH